MNATLKISALTLGLISVLGLTACQNTSTNPERGAKHSQKDERGMRGERKHREMTAEEKAQFEQRQAQARTACEGKIGQTISLKMDDNKTIEGKCSVDFRPNMPTNANGEMPPAPNGETPPTPPKDGKAKGEFKHRNKDDRRAEHETANKACEGKAGQTISVTMGDKTIQGQCVINFHPNRPEKGERFAKGEMPPAPPSATAK